MSRTLITILIAIALTGCNAQSRDTSVSADVSDVKWEDVPVNVTDPMTGIKFSVVGDPANDLNITYISKMFVQVQMWMGVSVSSAPHVIYTDQPVENNDDNPHEAVIWYRESTNIIVVDASYSIKAVRAITCHEFVHHVYNKAMGYGGDNEYQDQHDGPYYDICEKVYRFEEYGEM